MSAKNLTMPQRRCLEILRDAGDRPIAPRDVAMQMWPDSKGWNKVSRRGSTPAGGARGATMPMKAATLLWRLQGMGYAGLDDYRWHITERGRRALDVIDL